MTKLTEKQLKVIADYEALCRDIMPDNMTCIDYAVNRSRTYGYMHYNGGCVLFDTIQEGLDKFATEVPNECEIARRNVERLETELASAKANMALACSA